MLIISGNKMGASFDILIKNKNNKTIEEIEASLKRKGFKDFNGDLNIARNFKTPDNYNWLNLSKYILSDYLKENIINLHSTWASLGTRFNNKIILNKLVIHLSNFTAVSVMNILKENIAVVTTEANIFAQGLKIDLDKFYGIYYKDFSEIYPILKDSINRFCGKVLNQDEIKKMIDEATTIEEEIDGVKCKYFMAITTQPGPHFKGVENTFFEIVKNKYGGWK